MDARDDDRSLSGLGVSKWMRRSDRPDFMDMCASSPPADGFFYPTHPQREQKPVCPSKGESLIKREMSGGKYIPPFRSESEQNITCMKEGDQVGFFKTFGPNTAYPAASVGDLSLANSRTVLNMDSKELEKWAKKNISAQGELDTAPTLIDHLAQYKPNITTRISTREDAPTTGRRLDTISTPDVTPCATPSVTPAASPRVSRKPGNPFFSGDLNPQKNDGSWLFRPGPKNTSDNMMYEAKVEIQQSGGGSGQGTKTIRYVPRPSKLRELNFFSPTSM